MSTTKITNGANDRPKNETIAQSGGGIPDDSGSVVDITDEEVERTRDKLTGGDAHERLSKQVQEEIELPLKGSA